MEGSWADTWGAPKCTKINQNGAKLSPACVTPWPLHDLYGDLSLWIEELSLKDSELCKFHSSNAQDDFFSSYLGHDLIWWAFLQVHIPRKLDLTPYILKKKPHKFPSIQNPPFTPFMVLFVAPAVQFFQRLDYIDFHDLHERDCCNSWSSIKWIVMKRGLEFN